MFTTDRISWLLCLLCFFTATSSSAAQHLQGRSEQTQAQCGSDFSWMTNSQHLSPCYLTAFVWGSCFTGNWDVPQLPSGQQYNNPNSTTANLCTCSWAAYNLISACTACQGVDGSVQNWAAYMQDCNGFLTNTYFPSNVILPNGTAIPYWATTDPTTWNDGHFDTAQAQALAEENKPDIIQGQTPPASNKKSKAPIGAIVGGVIGGLAVLVLGGLLAWRIMIVRKREGGIREIDTDTHPYMIQAAQRPPHGRSLSDLSGKSTINPQSVSMSVITSQRPGTIYTTGTHTHTASVHSLSYASGQTSPIRVMSPPPAIQIAMANREERIEPFDIHSPRLPIITRKVSETTMTAYSHGHDTLAPPTPAAAAEMSHRERLNPPPYEYASPPSSPEPTEPVFRTTTPTPTRPGHRTHPEKASVDSQQSWDSTTSHGGGGGHIDDVVARMGLTQGGPQNNPENNAGL